MKIKWVLFILLMFSAQLSVAQENDTILNFNPFRPIFLEDDPESRGLKHLVSVYYHDDTHVYFQSKRDVGSSRSIITTSYDKMEGAMVEGFQAYEGTWYAKDKHSVFYREFKIEDADSDTFEPFNRSYAKDKKNVYFKVFKVQEADLNTFTAIDMGGYYDFAYDKNLLYFYDKRIPIDSATFSVDCFEDGFHNVCRDKNNIYYIRGSGSNGYIAIHPKDDAMILDLFKEKGNQASWSVRPHKVKVKATNKETEAVLQEKIYEDFINSTPSYYTTFEEGTYRLQNLTLSLAYENHETVYNVEPSGGNFLSLTEDATERYKAQYPDSGITEVLLIKAVHTD